jgi:hypothetical protein
MIMALVGALLPLDSATIQVADAPPMPQPTPHAGVNEAEQVQAVIAAVKAAGALERLYWRNPHAFPSRADIHALYRRGYGPELAEHLTEFTLSGSGDPATWVPDQVHVVAVDAQSALAWYPTPPDFGSDGAWGLLPYMVVRLERDGRRWIIVESEDRMQPPSDGAGGRGSDPLDCIGPCAASCVLQGVRANAQTSTHRQPAPYSTRANSETVPPVVTTSSTMATRRPPRSAVA